MEVGSFIAGKTKSLPYGDLSTCHLSLQFLFESSESRFNHPALQDLSKSDNAPWSQEISQAGTTRRRLPHKTSKLNGPTSAATIAEVNSGQCSSDYALKIQTSTKLLLMQVLVRFQQISVAVLFGAKERQVF